MRLQPLTPEQIDRYLAGMGDELVAVRDALQHDPALQELAQSPLMLSIMTLAYRGASAQDLAPGTPEARRKHLLDAYVRQMFKRRGHEKQPYSTCSNTGLACLARPRDDSTQSDTFSNRAVAAKLAKRAEMESGLYFGFQSDSRFDHRTRCRTVAPD